MYHQEKRMRRKKKTFALKLMAAVFITLMVLRSDWLASVFIKSNQSEDNSWNLPEDIVHGKQGQKSILREILNGEDQKSRQEGPDCSNPHLKSRKENETVTMAGNCKRIKPFKSACRLAAKLFGDPSTLDITGACKTPFTREYCNISGSADNWSVHCDISSCRKSLYIGEANDNGKYTWKLRNSNDGLTKAVKRMLKSSKTRYCFLACVDMSPEEERRVDQNFDTERRNPQLLILPPVPLESQSKVENESRRHLNLNFIFIDSVSRDHFYRSLPHTVKALDSMAAGFQDNKLMVLDFELVQGVRLRTFENLQTLFSGSINPFEVPFGTQEMPRQILNLQKILVPLRNLGYSNLWLEDLCPLWEWGLSKDLLVYNKSLSYSALYSRFIEASQTAGIDDLGTTFTSCDILNANEVPDPFHAPDKICYNGKHQHDYMLSYLKMFQQTMLHRAKPFLSFFETNIGHIGSGKRIQYLDTALAEYLVWSRTMTNTLTIVFSDHGNAYGDFVSNARDGRIEVYHPVLFMLIPDKVQSFFTDHQLQALTTNQHRLISVLDLHYTVMHITKMLHTEFDSRTKFENKVNDFNKQFNVTKYGLLTEISPARTCSHIPRIMPNLCICEGYDITTKNRAYHFIVAVYFVGMMNNKIQTQRHGTKKKDAASVQGGFGSCQRMKVKKMKNIQESVENDQSKMSKMDLYVKTDGQTEDEIFFISIQITKNSSFALGNFDRITPYGKYSNCSDMGIDLKLCICNSENKHVQKTALDDMDPYDVLQSTIYSDLKENITSFSINGGECLYIISQSNKAGVVYEAFNNCKMPLLLELFLKPVNLVLSSGNKVHVRMLQGDITFLTAGVSEVKNGWSCDMSLKVNI